MRAIGHSPCVAAATFAVCLVAVDAQAVPAREYQLEEGGAVAPHLRVELGTDSNPLRSSSGSAASPFLRIEPTVDYIVRNRNNRLRFRYAGEYLEYTTSYCRSVPSASNGVVEAGDCPEGASALNKASYQDHLLSANTYLDINRRLRVTGDLSFARQNQALGTGLTANVTQLAAVVEPDSYTDTTASVSLSYGAARAKGELRARLAYVDRNFDEDSANPGRNLSDLSERRINPRAALYYRVGTRTQAFGGIGLSQVRGGNAERDNTTVFAGLEFDTSGITTGSIRLNSVSQDFVDNSLEDVSFTGFDLAITWRPRTYSTVVFSGNRQTERGQFDTTGVGLSTTLSADWNHFWTDLFSTRVRLESINNDQANITAANQGDGSSGDDRSIAARFEANYNVRRWLDVGAFFESDSRTGQDNVGRDRQFDRTVIGITVNGTI